MKRLLVVLAFLLLAPPAAAKTVAYKRFVSPSGQIRCYAVKYGGKGIECFADYLERTGELDPYLGLEPRGKARRSERGDFPGFPNAKERTLAYGDVWKRKGIRCTMRSTGLRCVNRDGHGFHMARGDVRLF